MTNDIGLFLARVALGASIASHGTQKAFGWFGGPGRQGAAHYFESLGFTPGDRFVAAASYTEMTSGSLIALGLGGPIGPAGVIATMIVAMVTVHAKNGYYAAKGGIEIGTIYSAAALAFAGGGYGTISLDQVLGLEDERSHWFTALALAGGIAGALAILAQRNTGAAGTHTSENGAATPLGEQPSSVPESAS